MRRYRRNADRDIRKLQRAAAAGDIEASDQLVIEDLRNGRLSYESAVGVMVVSRGPIMGWDPTWEYPGFLKLTPPLPWSDYVHVLATPWWEREGTSFSPFSLVTQHGSQEEGLRDLFTPNTGDLHADVANYIAELTGAFMALSFAGAAIMQGQSGLGREAAWDIISEGISGA